jgi:chemotaxis signal transduction protein
LSHAETPDTDPADADVLRRRADRLAAQGAARADAPGLAVVAFTLGERRCAVPMDCVSQVAAAGEIVPLPFPAPHVLGTAKLRGAMLPVLDLAGLLQLPAAAATGLVVLGRERPRLALPATAIAGVSEMDTAALERGSAPLAGLQPGTVVGMDRAGVMLLDGEPLLALFDAAATAPMND